MATNPLSVIKLLAPDALTDLVKDVSDYMDEVGHLREQLKAAEKKLENAKNLARHLSVLAEKESDVPF